ncbi:MAG: type I-C CRISPR-associated endonuclease Cas1c [Candidatus Contendobacter sp.]|nr:type I-C CRISPR-associated endonuclease Cas1c [Candidatus Contendobacter sp.]
MRHLLNTLYVMTQGAYLHLEGETLVVEIERQKRLQVPLHHLGSVVIFGDIMVSPAAFHRCADDGRGVVLLDRRGQFKARLEGPLSGNILLRQAQHRAAATQALELARAFVAGKLRNARQIVLRGARDTNNDADREALRQNGRLLASHIRRLSSVTTLDQARGEEGDGARVYFSAVRYLIRADAREVFSFERRSRRPPLDRFNALISFLYTLLVHDCRTAVESVGLDAQLGFLHTVRPGRPALALDLMEEFRPLADRLALTLINRGQLTEKDFEARPGGAVYLSETGRKTVLAAYQQRKQEEIGHALLQQPVPVGLLPHVQARLLARVLRGDVEGYLPFLVR